MLAVFLIGTMPKEYLHSMLYRHKDTVHRDYAKGEIVITTKHIHCAFMGFAFAPYIAAKKQFLSFKEYTRHTVSYVLPVYHFSYSSERHIASLRGPPYIS